MTDDARDQDEPVAGRREADAVIAACRKEIDADAFRPDPYQKLYLRQRERKAYDEAWCAAAAVAFLRSAGEETQRFFEDHRRKGPPVVRNRLDDEQWTRNLRHEEGREFAKIFEAVAPAALKVKIERLAREKKLPELPPQFRQDPATSTVTFARIFGWTAQVLGLPCPDLHVRMDLPGGLTAVVSDPPASIAGQTVLTAFSPEELLFVLGKHIAMYRGEHYIKTLFPTSADQASLFFAGIRVIAPDVAPPPALVAQVVPLVIAIRRHTLQRHEREGLRMAVDTFLAGPSRGNMKQWAQAVEITACRAGLLLSGDLEIAGKILSAEPQHPDDLTPEEKLRELLRFSVSEKYHALRVALGIAVTVPPTR